MGLESLIRVNFRLESLIRDYFGLESLIRQKFGCGPQPGLLWLFLSVRSGETIEISYDDVSQIPFGSQITCGAGPHDTTADPDPSQPTALIQIAPREQVNISHEVQQTSVISDVRSDEQGELRGVGNYNSAGFFFCKSWGYPFPEVKWQKG